MTRMTRLALLAISPASAFLSTSSRLSSSRSLPRPWTSDSWRRVRHVSPLIPQYFNTSMYDYITHTLKNSAPIVFAREVSSLENALGLASVGKSFVLIGGDCAETFEDSSVDKLWLDFVLLLHSSLLLSYGIGKPVVKIGRLAGQYAKPRSTLLETRGNVTLPVYQGDIINSQAFTQDARVPDPHRMWAAYTLSVQSMNILRAFIQGGYTTIHNVGTWMEKLNITHNDSSPLSSSLKRALRFVSTIGIPETMKPVQDASFFIGHEALLLPYEECLVRRDSMTQEMYACSAHFLWIGERTRELDGAHVEFLRGVKNPIGVKISSSITPDELLELTHLLNPHNIPGRLTIMTRMGASRLRTHLPPLIEMMKTHSRHVVWVCDPMHANTHHINGRKIRRVDDILDEVLTFFRVHTQCGTTAGGIHLEMTGQPVTECEGGTFAWYAHKEYMSTTAMDPRLNPYQVLEVVLRLSEHVMHNDTR